LEPEVTGSLGYGKQSTPSSSIEDILRSPLNDTLDRLSIKDIIDGGQFVYGDVGAGKTSPPRKRKKNPESPK
jgi:hypothetical protein